MVSKIISNDWSIKLSVKRHSNQGVIGKKRKWTLIVIIENLIYILNRLVACS